MSNVPSTFRVADHCTAEMLPPVRQTTPLWLWINILSLDAPVVAVLWNLLSSESLGVQTGFFVPVALGFSVWVIYLWDHVLDSHATKPSHAEPARKVFFRNHPQLTMSMAASTLLFTLCFARAFLSPAMFRAGVNGGMLVALYFGLVHLLPARMRLYWPREAAVALLFSCGVCLPMWVAAAGKRDQVVAVALPLFLLCWMNCCAVEIWDWRNSGGSSRAKPNASALWIAGHIPLFACLILLLSLRLAILQQLPASYVAAVGLSNISLTATARLDGRRSTAVLCFLTDLALCAPLPILFLIWFYNE